MTPKLLTEFSFEGKPESVKFTETIKVTDGVECDVYAFDTDSSKDLGIIRINPGAKTPLQKVLKGKRTVEGHVSGKGSLIITRAGGKKKVYHVDNNTEKFQTDVGIGDTMQWQADEDSELTAFEICIPPYEDGRYENLE